MNDVLSAAQVLACMQAASIPAAASGLQIECVEQTGSTNADLLQRLPLLDSPLLLAAENQTAGRGRAGREWLAQPYSSLTFSLAWPFFRRQIGGLLGLPLAVGVAVAEALAGFGVTVTLKWPNDVQIEEAKVGGILIETGVVRNAGHAQPWAVLGIGLNIALASDTPARLGRAVGQMPQLLGCRNQLLAALATRLAAMLPRFDVDGFAPFAADWNRLHAHAGKQICIVDRGRVIHEGRAIGADESGCLLIATGEGLVRINAGDVSLRPMATASAGS